jgi:hypothetical protein
LLRFKFIFSSLSLQQPLLVLLNLAFPFLNLLSFFCLEHLVFFIRFFQAIFEFNSNEFLVFIFFFRVNVKLFWFTKPILQLIDFTPQGFLLLFTHFIFKTKLAVSSFIFAEFLSQSFHVVSLFESTILSMEYFLFELFDLYFFGEVKLFQINNLLLKFSYMILSLLKQLFVLFPLEFRWCFHLLWRHSFRKLDIFYLFFELDVFRYSWIYFTQ